MDLTTNYIGLKLKNPIIIGSSGLTESVEKIKDLADNNAGAVVLKSLFEEQIMAEVSQNIYDDQSGYTDAYEYISEYTKEHNIDKYLNLIKKSKEAIDIPVIASINCISDHEWISFAKKFEDAGADALEINVSMLPTDDNRSSEENENIYFDIIEKVRKEVNIPISLKMSHYSAGLANLIKRICWTKNVNGIVLFNRYYSPDIDIVNFKITATNILSTPEEISTSLRWIALLSDKVECDLVASTGVHNGEGIIKQTLAGATAVQIVSAIYKHGPEHISTILKDTENWMEKNNFSTLDDFRGKMSYEKIDNPAAFERVQFMKYFAGIK